MINLTNATPVTSSETFEHISSTFAVYDERRSVWDYYPMKMPAMNGDQEVTYLDYDIAPPVVANGIISVKKYHYFEAKEHDILRGRLNVRNRHTNPSELISQFTGGRVSNTAAERNSELPTESDGTSDREPVRTGPQPDADIGSDTWLRECEDANLAFENQVRSLLGTYDSQELGGQENNSRSGSDNESNPIQDLAGYTI